ncbi:hypothetical protein Jab_1c19080 [Janthinobacterium sp. HH01]|nr:hypothetical protein Jab_1c19080 [Janthinobacterium sp. HH01]
MRFALITPFSSQPALPSQQGAAALEGWARV